MRRLGSSPSCATPRGRHDRRHRAKRRRAPGRIAASSSGDKPRLAKVPGRYPCENTSALRTSPRRISTSAGARRMTKIARKLTVPTILFLVPKAGQMWAGDLMTSAPCSASVRAQVGPARTRVRSRTRMPESGRSPVGSGSEVLSPMRMISISGSAATAAACGCLAHSACVRAMPPVPFAPKLGSRPRARGLFNGPNCA